MHERLKALSAIFLLFELSRCQQPLTGLHVLSAILSMSFFDMDPKQTDSMAAAAPAQITV